MTLRLVLKQIKEHAGQNFPNPLWIWNLADEALIDTAALAATVSEEKGNG